MDINGDNSELLSDEMIYEFKQQFDKLANPVTNKITIPDLQTIIKDMGYIASIEELHNVMSETNHYVDFIYMLVIIGRILRKNKSEAHKKELVEAFFSLDKNKNGTIEIDELLSLEIHGFDPAILRQIFLSIDTDHDGHITMEEYINFLENEY